MGHHMNVFFVAPHCLSCYSVCTQKHAPWYHNGMNALQGPCKGDIHWNDMVEDKDVGMKAP